MSSILDIKSTELLRLFTGKTCVKFLSKGNNSEFATGKYKINYSKNLVEKKEGTVGIFTCGVYNKETKNVSMSAMSDSGGKDFALVKGLSKPKILFIFPLSSYNNEDITDRFYKIIKEEKINIFIDPCNISDHKKMIKIKEGRKIVDRIYEKYNLLLEINVSDYITVFDKIFIFRRFYQKGE